MTYASRQHMIDRFGQLEITELTDRANSGAIDGAVLDRALADADAEINARIASRYTLPLASVPTTLARIAGDIARYFLYEDRVTDQVRTRYADAIKFLDGVARGDISIGVDAINSAVSPDAGTPQYSAPDRVFTAGTLSDYAQ